MKNARRILLSVLLILLVFTATFALAETKVGPVSVSPSLGNDRYLNLTFDFTVDGKEYTTFVTGITSDVNSSLWAPGLADEIAEHIAKEKRLRISTESTGRSWEYVEPRIDLIDAEKQNLKGVNWTMGDVPSFNSDSVLCWAAGASNALEISGWGRAMTARHPDKVNLQNVDDIFEYFDANFTDCGFLAVNGYRWFLTGANGGSNVGQIYNEDTDEVEFGVFHDGDAQLYTKGSGGLAPEFCVNTIGRSNYDVIYEGTEVSFVTMKGMREAADDLEKGYGVAMGLKFGIGGHDLCMMGTVREKNGNTKGDVVAVFLADSDNDAPTYAYGNEEATAKAGPRRERVNSYEMYTVKAAADAPDPVPDADEEETGPDYNYDDEEEEPIEDDEDWDDIFGDEDVDPDMFRKKEPVVYLMNFWMHKGGNENISDLMSIRPYSSDLPKETKGTGDVYASPDLVPLGVEILLAQFDSGAFMNVKAGQKVTIDSAIHNQSFAWVTKDDSATLTIRYHIYKDGTEVDSVTVTKEMTGSMLYPYGKVEKNAGLEIPYVFEKPGVYNIAVEIVKVTDSKGAIREAYVQNNTLMFARATVTGEEADPELPKTGDESHLVLWLLLLLGACGMLAGLQKKKM